jgi:hypothetical protein
MKYPKGWALQRNYKEIREGDWKIGKANGDIVKRC